MVIRWDMVILMVIIIITEVITGGMAIQTKRKGIIPRNK
jgi:hypothetical protein